jgi:hypothetical protein
VALVEHPERLLQVPTAAEAARDELRVMQAAFVH